MSKRIETLREWFKFALFVPALFVYVVFSTVAIRFPNKVTLRIDKALCKLVRRLAV